GSSTKGMGVDLRGGLANAWTGVRESARKRGEFYRAVRALKMRRHRIAQAVYELAQDMASVDREVAEMGSRYAQEMDPKLVEAAKGDTSRAARIARAAAADLSVFARQRIWF